MEQKEQLVRCSRCPKVVPVRATMKVGEDTLCMDCYCARLIKNNDEFFKRLRTFKPRKHKEFFG